MTTPTPAWLRRHLADQGHIDIDSGATEAARITRCGRCRRPTWVALEPRGLSRRLDLQPLTALGEALAILNGRTTCGMYREAGALRIESRTTDRIRGHPAASPGTDVLLEHRCQDPPINLPRTGTSITWPVTPPPATDQPPF